MGTNEENNKQKRDLWTNEEKIELVKLRLQGFTFSAIGVKMNRSKHSARSEYGRIRRGETDIVLSFKEIPELRKLLPSNASKNR
jgi:transposase-like protein